MSTTAIEASHLAVHMLERLQGSHLWEVPPLFSILDMRGDLVRPAAVVIATVEEVGAAEVRPWCAHASSRTRRLPPLVLHERCYNLDSPQGLCSGCLEFRRFARESEDEVG